MSAMPLSPALAEVLARGDVWRGDTLASLPAATIPSGYPELDAELPGGGWPRGNLTEVLVDRSGQGELSLLLPALASLSAAGGWLALVAPPCLPYAPAWAAAGIALERLLLIRPGQQRAWCLEQLLASGGFAGVLAWLGNELEPRVLRRLQVAAEGQAVFTVLWRSTAAAASPSPAPLRIALEADAVRDVLRLRILKRRGRPAVRALLLANRAALRSGRGKDVVAGPAFSVIAAGSAAAAAVA